MRHSPKYLLCRPQGGINDTLTQIECCWRYSQATDRFLVVDTANRGGFGMPFAHLFDALDDTSRVVFDVTDVLQQRLERMEVIPSAVFGRLNTYEPEYDPEVKNFIDKTSRERLTFDFRTQHQAQLLLHDQAGGTLVSLDCLKRLRMTRHFQHDVLSVLSDSLVRPYEAVMVRNNSDYKTDYPSLFESLKPKIETDRLLVVSDDSDVIAYAKSCFNDREVFTLPDILGFKMNKPYAELMYELGAQQRYQMVLKAFSDLMATVLARRLYVSRLKSGGIGGGYSGFVLLAASLFKNRSILETLFPLLYRKKN